MENLEKNVRMKGIAQTDREREMGMSARWHHDEEFSLLVRKEVEL